MGVHSLWATERAGFRRGFIVCETDPILRLTPRLTARRHANLLLIGRVARLGMAFISVDYQLIPPAMGHDILHDIKDVFIFLERDVNRLIRERWIPSSRVGRVFQIDSHRLAVSGSSAGGLCAYLAAIHAHPRPKAVLSLYGMGGDMLASITYIRALCCSAN